MISENQRVEWPENPVTTELFRLVNKKLKTILETPTANCLFYGEPVKTHEALIMQDAEVFLYTRFADALMGEWDFFEELEDDSNTDESEVNE